MGTNYAHIFSFCFKICADPCFKMAPWPKTVKNPIHNEEQALDMLTKKKKELICLICPQSQTCGENMSKKSKVLLSRHSQHDMEPSRCGPQGETALRSILLCLLSSLSSFFPFYEYLLRTIIATGSSPQEGNSYSVRSKKWRVWKLNFQTTLGETNKFSLESTLGFVQTKKKKLKWRQYLLLPPVIKSLQKVTIIIPAFIIYFNEFQLSVHWNLMTWTGFDLFLYPHSWPQQWNFLNSYSLNFPKRFLWKGLTVLMTRGILWRKSTIM